MTFPSILIVVVVATMSFNGLALSSFPSSSLVDLTRAVESSARPLFPQWSNHVYPQFLPGSHPNHHPQQQTPGGGGSSPQSGGESAVTTAGGALNSGVVNSMQQHNHNHQYYQQTQHVHYNHSNSNSGPAPATNGHNFVTEINTMNSYYHHHQQQQATQQQHHPHQQQQFVRHHHHTHHHSRGSNLIVNGGGAGGGGAANIKSHYRNYRNGTGTQSSSSLGLIAAGLAFFVRVQVQSNPKKPERKFYFGSFSLLVLEP